MDLLAFAKDIADRAEAAASRAQTPVAVCVIHIHGNVVLMHRISGAPLSQSNSPNAKPIPPHWCACERPTFFRSCNPDKHSSR